MLRTARKLSFLAFIISGAVLIELNHAFWGAYAFALAFAADVLLAGFTKEVFSLGGWFSHRENPAVYWVGVSGFLACSLFCFYWAATQLH